MAMDRSSFVYSPRFRGVAKGMSGELDQPVVLLLREHGSHVEHVLEHRLLQLALCTMNFLDGGFYPF